MDELAGRIAFVTGAARGIGLAVAEALAGRGAGVAMLDIDITNLTSTAHSIGARTLAIEADVSRPDEVQRAMRQTVEHFGGLNILVNNAGICPMSDIADITEAEWDRVLAINLKGAFLCCQAALPYLRKSGRQGRIVNIASVAGQMGGVAVGAHYSASKAGLIGLGKSLARLLAADGVTVNCVAPGTAATDLIADWSEETKRRLSAQIPLGRFAQAEEIAEAVCFLASDQAGFITGATLDVNGGLYLR
jgi:NAD(P)-dependent dehydrogenase (short-subunit alcohol dehydrogenase family)